MNQNVKSFLGDKMAAKQADISYIVSWGQMGKATKSENIHPELTH